MKYGRSKRERWYLYGKSVGLHMKMEPIEGSETSAIINQTSGNYPKGNLLYSVHGESLKSRILKYYIISK